MIDKDLLGWLTNADIESTKYYAPKANHETLIEALSIERRAGAANAIKRELFARLNVGDQVIVGCGVARVAEVFPHRKYVKLESYQGRFGWKDVDFVAGVSNGK